MHGLGDEDLAVVEESFSQAYLAKPKPKGKAAPKRKPATKAPKHHSKKEVNPDEKEVKAGEKEAAHKTTWRHRKTSSTYHQQHKRQKAMGSSPNTAKRNARAAMRETAAKIDACLLTEN